MVGATGSAGLVVAGPVFVGLGVGGHGVRGHSRGRCLRAGHQLVELGGQRSLRLCRLYSGAPQLIGDEGEHQQTEGDQGAADAADHPSPIVGRLGTIPVADLLVTCGGFLGHGSGCVDLGVTLVEPPNDAIGMTKRWLERWPVALPRPMETDPVVQLVDVVAVLDRFPALAGATLDV